MEPVYKYSESTEQPMAIEFGVNCAYLRKDITEQKRIDMDNNPVTYWTYQEAIMSKEEFNIYANQLVSANAVKGVNDSENIVQIIAGQLNSDGNQMVIMEALADLYDALASLA